MLPFANYIISSNSMRERRRRKQRRPEKMAGEGGGEDDLAVVKAAAWAWYQRNEGKPMREFDITRATSRISPRPSRYKLEAAKNTILSENRVLAENRVSKSSLPYNNGDESETLYSHLLDAYEIESISKRMDDFLHDFFPVSPTSNVFQRNDDHDHDHGYGNDDDDDGLEERKISYGHSKNSNVIGFVKKVNYKKLWGRWMLMAPATVCGRSNDGVLPPPRRTGKAVAAALVQATRRGK